MLFIKILISLKNISIIFRVFSKFFNSLIQGRPGARMESGSGNELVKAKIDLVAAGHFLQKEDYQR